MKFTKNTLKNIIKEVLLNEDEDLENNPDMKLLNSLESEFFEAVNKVQEGFKTANSLSVKSGIESYKEIMEKIRDKAQNEEVKSLATRGIATAERELGKLNEFKKLFSMYFTIKSQLQELEEKQLQELEEKWHIIGDDIPVMKMKLTP